MVTAKSFFFCFLSPLLYPSLAYCVEILRIGYQGRYCPLLLHEGASSSPDLWSCK